MDYSAVHQDSEHLTGPSPWGSSSPKASRESFPTSSDESPPSPIATHERTPFPVMQEGPTASIYSDIPTQGQSILERTEPEQGVSSMLPEQPPQQQPQPQLLSQHTPQQQKPGAARYQSARQQRPPPQYKLQAKITALERTGRKDPVLRFDVYVCVVYLYLLTFVKLQGRRIYQSFEPRNSEMCDGPTPSLSSSLTISYPPIPKQWYLQSLPASPLLALGPTKMKLE